MIKRHCNNGELSERLTLSMRPWRKYLLSKTFDLEIPIELKIIFYGGTDDKS
jgi:hypothetical protein